MDKRNVYTEIRIPHKTKEDKLEYETKLNEALKKNGYAGRAEFVREKIRDLIRDTK